MNAQQLTDKLATLKAQRPVTVLGAAVIDVIADAYALPWCGCDIELQQQSVNVGGVAFPEDNLCVSLDNVYFTVEELNQRSFFIVDFQLCVNEQLFPALS